VVLTAVLGGLFMIDLAFTPAIPVAKFSDTDGEVESYCFVFNMDGPVEDLIPAVREFYPDGVLVFVRYTLDKEWEVVTASDRSYYFLNATSDLADLYENIADRFFG
jgi:hypothetical protein